MMTSTKGASEKFAFLTSCKFIISRPQHCHEIAIYGTGKTAEYPVFASCLSLWQITKQDYSSSLETTHIMKYTDGWTMVPSKNISPENEYKGRL